MKATNSSTIPKLSNNFKGYSLSCFMWLGSIDAICGIMVKTHIGLKSTIPKLRSRS
jgi:hypothetical protein